MSGLRSIFGWTIRYLQRWWSGFDRSPFSAIKKIVAIFILLCLLSLVWWIWFEEGGIIILPFQTPQNQDYNGQSLSELLTHDLSRLKEIHQTEIQFGTRIIENYTISEFTPAEVTLDYSLSQIGMLGQGSISLSVGDILLSLKRLLPHAKPTTILAASLQNYGTKIVIVASLASSNGIYQTWQISSNKNCSQEEIPQLVQDLAYQVAYSTSPREANSTHTWKAFAAITQGLEAYQTYRVTKNMSYLEKAFLMALEAHESEPEYMGSYQILTAVGTEYIFNNNNQQAITIFDEIIQLNPKYAKAWIYKGVALADLGKLDETIKAFDRAIEINPQYADAWYNKGVALGKQDKLDEAIKAYDRAIGINPQYADAWYNKGVDLADLGKLDEAIKAYDRAIEINPQYAAAWYNKGIALGKQDKLDEAIKAFDRAIEINPQNAEAWYSKGIALYKQDKLDEAIKAFDRAIEINPQDAEAWYRKGIVFKLLGRTAEEDAAFAKAKELGFYAQ